MPDPSQYTNVADVRALVRSMTGGSAHAWRRTFDGDTISTAARLPTCPVCANLLDLELSTTTQNWDAAKKAFPPYQARAKEQAELATALLGATEDW